MKIVRQTLCAALVLCAVLQSCAARLYNPFLPNFPPPHFEKTHQFFSAPGPIPRSISPISTNDIDLPFTSLDIGPVSPPYLGPPPFIRPYPGDVQVHRPGPPLNPFMPSDVMPVQRLHSNPLFDLVHSEEPGRYFGPPQPIEVGPYFDSPESFGHYPPFSPFQGGYVGPQSSHPPMQFNDFENIPTHHPSDIFESSPQLRFDRGTPIFYPEDDVNGFNGGNGFNDFNGFNEYNGFVNGPWESSPPMSPHFEMGPFNSFEGPAKLVSPFPPPAFQNSHPSNLQPFGFDTPNDINPNPWNREPIIFSPVPVGLPIPHPSEMRPIGRPMDYMEPRPIHNIPQFMGPLRPMKPLHPMMSFVQPHMTPMIHPTMNHLDHLPPFAEPWEMGLFP
ncbi:uncharacterized protein LOC143022252 [Oratosquilla oratoria]|uniref:uncharacterized protein LOC143022252 n=1 Tax=Oratosquilla oratoria TaxID=337810 RepID=UPI003F75C6C3